MYTHTHKQKHDCHHHHHHIIIIFIIPPVVPSLRLRSDSPVRSINSPFLSKSHGMVPLGGTRLVCQKKKKIKRVKRKKVSEEHNSPFLLLALSAKLSRKCS
jgi:hypothetical protein